MKKVSGAKKYNPIRLTPEAYYHVKKKQFELTEEGAKSPSLSETVLMMK